MPSRREKLAQLKRDGYFSGKFCNHYLDITRHDICYCKCEICVDGCDDI